MFLGIAGTARGDDVPQGERPLMDDWRDVLPNKLSLTALATIGASMAKGNLQGYPLFLGKIWLRTLSESCSALMPIRVNLGLVVLGPIMAILMAFITVILLPYQLFVVVAFLAFNIESTFSSLYACERTPM